MNCGNAMSLNMRNAFQGGSTQKMEEAKHMTGIPGFGFYYQRNNVIPPSPATKARMRREHLHEHQTQCISEPPSNHRPVSPAMAIPDHQCRPEPPSMSIPDPLTMSRPPPPRLSPAPPPCGPAPMSMCTKGPNRLCKQEMQPKAKRRWGEGDKLVSTSPSNKEPLVIGKVTTRTVKNTETTNDLGVTETERSDVTKKEHIYKYDY